MSKLPSIVSQLPNDVRMFLDRVREALGSGQLLTRDDLLRGGIAVPGRDGGLIPAKETPIVPPAPTGVTTFSGLSTIILEWDKPNYGGHAYAEVWRAGVDDLGQAQVVGQAGGWIFADPVGGNVQAYYWVRFVSVTDTAGPFNGTAGVSGTVGYDPAYLIEVLSAESPGALLYKIHEETEINGVLVPAGVYIRDLFVANGSISGVKIGKEVVDDSHIANLSAAKVTFGEMDGDRIEANTLDADRIIVNTLSARLAYIDTEYVNNSNIVNAVITTAKIRDAAITNAKIGNAEITTAKIRDAAITAAKIENATITTAQIANGAITNAKIANASIDNAEIVNGAIDNAKIANAAISYAKIGHAEVGTLTLGGNVVTIPLVFSGVGDISGSLWLAQGATLTVTAMSLPSLVQQNGMPINTLSCYINGVLSQIIGYGALVDSGSGNEGSYTPIWGQPPLTGVFAAWANAGAVTVRLVSSNNVWMQAVSQAAMR